MNWEYKTLRMGIDGGWRGVPKTDPARIDAAFGELGREGWELVSALDVNVNTGASFELVAIFKRPLAAR
jgi:Domain of unknown function (DUF4177)